MNFYVCYFCNLTNEYKLINLSYCSIIPSTPDPPPLYYYYFKDSNYPALGYCHESDKIPAPVVEDKSCPQDQLYYLGLDTESPTPAYNQFECISGSNLCPEGYKFLDPDERMCVKSDLYDSNYVRYPSGFMKSIEYLTTTTIAYNFNNILLNKRIHFSKNFDYIEEYWDHLDEKIQDGTITSTGYIHSEDTTFYLTSSYEQDSYINIQTRNNKNNNFLFDSYSNYFSDSYPTSFYFRNKYENYRNTRRVSILYLSECEKIIKLINGLDPYNTDLLILKLDIYKSISKEKITTSKVVYKIYNPNAPNNEIDLGICSKYPINIITPISASRDEESESYKLLQILKNVKKEEYDPFNVYSDFYTEVCEQYKTQYDTDMNMKDRKQYIYDKIKNFYFCQKNCYYSSTDEDVNYINCICSAKNYDDIGLDISDASFNTLEKNIEENYKNEEQKKLLDDINNNKINDYFNFYLMKCIKLLFSYDGFTHNYVSIIILCLLVAYLLLIFLYLCTGFDFYINVLKEFLFHKHLYREYWRIKKKAGDISSKDNNISMEEEFKEKNPLRFNNQKIQNRTNTQNVFEKVKKFKPTEDNKWIRINKSSVLIDPLKDDQIKPINEYSYKDKEVYKNKDNKIRDYQNDYNINNNAPPKRTINNNYYHMGKNNDLINARTVKPITSHNYDDIQAIVKGKQKNEEDEEDTKEKNNIIMENIDNDSNTKKEEKGNNNINNIIEKSELEQKDDDLSPVKFNKKTEMHNTSSAIYIYNLILNDLPSDIPEENTEEERKSNLITKREYSFLNDGEINELDFDNSVFHDKRSFMRIYYSFLKYNCIIIFTFFVCEDFNLNFVKYYLFIFYAILYLTFNTAFFNNNSLHNIYINEGDYEITYHIWKIFLAFILSLIFIKLFKWWITFYRRRSLSMKLLKRYTDAKNEIIEMITQYHFHLKIFIPISIALFIIFWYYVSTVFAVFRYSYWYLLLNWAFCALVHLGYSLVLNFIPAALRFAALRKQNNCLFKASKIVSYFL